MSQLQQPRLHFRGEFQTNVPTCNNDDIAAVFPTQQFVDAARIAVDTSGMNDADFALWLRQLAPPFGIRAGWNLYGDCRCSFDNVMVQSAHPADRDVITDAATDPIVNAAVTLDAAVMVDLDPEGTLGTQILCDQFSLFKSDNLSIIGRPVRFVSRFVRPRVLRASGFRRFCASWSAAIPHERLSISMGVSPTLDSFRAAYDNGAGLFISFSIYLLEPRISAQQLAQDFAVNRPTQNPAIGKVIGTLGIWNATSGTNSEMKTIAVGRRLNSATTLQHDHTPFEFNPAIASVDRTRRVVTLDLIQAVPEIDETLSKVNVGDLSLVLTTSGVGGSQKHVLGAVAYDRAAYERTSGLVEVAYPAALDTQIDVGQLSLVQTASGMAVLDELDTTVETDDRCVYLQVNESSTIAPRVLNKGRAPTAATSVQIRQYVTTNRGSTLATTATAVVDVPATITVPGGGSASIAVRGLRAGTCVLAFLPPGEASNSRQFFANVRVLPTDNYDAIPDSELTFAFIYQEVLRYYYLLYPAMNLRIDLSNEFKMTLKAQAIRDRIAKANWDQSNYMPVTRELSDGKRKLLSRWCDKILGG